MITLPKIGETLNDSQLDFLKTFTKSCRHDILQMVVNSQSGHPGGSLSSIDYLAVLYAFLISQTGEKVVISNGHISPAVYSLLGEMSYIDKEDAIKNFRKLNSIFEGHVTRHVPGVWYGTGPLGIGVSISVAFALAEKLKNLNTKVFGIMGDGEAQEGEVYEAIQFSNHHKLNNLVLFVDYNEVQLTDSLEKIQKLDIQKIFEAAGFLTININAHNYNEIWSAISKAYRQNDKPVVIIGSSIMGKGVELMEKDGRQHKSTWHGKAPKAEDAAADLERLKPTPEEEHQVSEFRKTIKWHPENPTYPPLLSELKINTGTPRIYDVNTITDCRSAYGQALSDLAKLNPEIIALTADLRSSVMTKFVAEALPNQHVECGIAEQNMTAIAGGLSLSNRIPFASTFGVFMSSRAKDQARVNDINYTNVKMVATHCGLSVGEDGPTHQAIDDMGSFLGMFNTMIIEPADPNQTDKIIRYIASHYGNFYVRMGRHKFPNLTKEDGTIFYDENYAYIYGKCDLIRKGKTVTVAATGALVVEAVKAAENLAKTRPNISAEIIAVSSIKKFDDTLIDSIKKTGKLITLEDHNTYSGLGSQLARHLEKENIKIDKFKMLGVENYQLSGKSEELYDKAGLSAEHIEKACVEIDQ